MSTADSVDAELGVAYLLSPTDALDGDDETVGPTFQLALTWKAVSKYTRSQLHHNRSPVILYLTYFVTFINSVHVTLICNVHTISWHDLELFT